MTHDDAKQERLASPGNEDEPDLFEMLEELRREDEIRREQSQQKVVAANPQDPQTGEAHHSEPASVPQPDVVASEQTQKTLIANPPDSQTGMVYTHSVIVSAPQPALESGKETKGSAPVDPGATSGHE